MAGGAIGACDIRVIDRVGQSGCVGVVMTGRARLCHRVDHLVVEHPAQVEAVNAMTHIAFGRRYRVRRRQIVCALRICIVMTARTIGVEITVIDIGR